MGFIRAGFVRTLCAGAFFLALAAPVFADETPGDKATEEKAEEAPPLNPLLADCLREQTADNAALTCTAAIDSRQLQGEALASALYTRGMAQGRRGQLPAAINDFNAALSLAPKATDALYARGSAQAATQRHDLAVADYSAVLAIDPTDTDSLYRRAWSYTMLGRDREAIADLTAVLAAADDDIDALMDRGGLNLRAGDFKAAAADFDAVAKADPSAAAALYNRGRVAALQNDFTAAAKDFAAAQAARDDNPYAALRRYLATVAGGKADKDILTAAIGRFPADQWPLPVLATLAGEMPEADLLAATEIDDKNAAKRIRAEAHFYLGEAARAQKDDKAARAHFEAAAKGDRTVPEVIDAGWRLKQLGE